MATRRARQTGEAAMATRRGYPWGARQGTGEPVRLGHASCAAELARTESTGLSQCIVEKAREHYAKKEESHGIHLSRFFCLLFACMLIGVPAPAEALEFSGGVSVGGIQIGTEAKLAVSPFIGLLWRKKRDFRLEVHNMFSVLPGVPVGFYDRTAVTLGYASKTSNLSLGPSLSIYWMGVCGAVWCDRVAGIAPGGHAQTDWYFAGPLGVSVSANLDWAGGRSQFLPSILVVMATAGPIWRFWGESK